MTSTPPETTGRTRRLTLIATLYSTQNLSLGFYTFAFLTIAQQQGVPLTAIGAAAGVALLLVLKFLWAPLVDKIGFARFGHYRGWLLLTQTVLGIGIASLALFDPATDFGVLLGVFAVLFVVAATQDIAADAAATRLLRPSERGIGNGFQSAGACVAQVVGGGLTLVVYQVAGWQAAALVLAVFSLVPLPFILAWREREASRNLPRPQMTLRSALSFFARSEVRWWCLLLLPAYTLGFTIAYNLIRPLLVDAGWSEAKIGLYVVIAGSIVGIAAGIVSGALISRIGRRRSLVWLGVLQIAGTAGTLPIALGMTQEWLVFLVVALGNAAFTAAFAIVYTICMDLSRPESAGTDFTYFTTVSQVVMVASAGAGVAMAGLYGFASVIAVGIILAIVGLAFTIWKFDKVEPRDGRTASAPEPPVTEAVRS